MLIHSIEKCIITKKCWVFFGGGVGWLVLFSKIQIRQQGSRVVFYYLF